MKALFAAIALLLVSACASVGTKFEMSDVDAMQPGVTTYSEAEHKLGKPDSVRFGADGSKSASWLWVQTGMGTQTQRRGVRILFDKDAKMVRLESKVGN